MIIVTLASRGLYRSKDSCPHLKRPGAVLPEKKKTDQSITWDPDSCRTENCQTQTQPGDTDSFSTEFTAEFMLMYKSSKQSLESYLIKSEAFSLVPGRDGYNPSSLPKESRLHSTQHG